MAHEPRFGTEWPDYLPYENLLSISEYLSSSQLVILSQVSTCFRNRFKPISWRNVMVLNHHNKNIVKQNLVPNYVKYRLIPLDAFLKIKRYSWINTDFIYFLMFDLCLFYSADKSFLNFTFLPSLFPNVDKVFIKNGLRYKKFPSEDAHIYIDHPNNLLSSSFFAFIQSELYLSLMRNYPSKKSPFDFSVEVNIYNYANFFGKLNFIQNVKNLNLDFPELINENFIPPTELILPNVEFLGIHHSNDLILGYIVDQLPKWPKLQEIESSIWLSVSEMSIIIENRLRHFQRLPQLSIFKLFICFENFLNSFQDEDFQIRLSSSRNEFFEIRPNSPHPTFFFPQLTHLETEVTLLDLDVSPKCFIQASNLKHIRFSANTFLNSSSLLGLNIASVTSLNLDTGTTKHEKFENNRLILALEHIGEFKNLKRLIVHYSGLKNRKLPHAFFYPQFCQLRNYYKDNQSLAPLELITDLAESGTVGILDFNQHKGNNYKHLRTLFYKVFSNSLDTDHDITSFVSQFKQSYFSDAVLSFEIVTFIIDLALLETLTNQLFKLQSIKYLAINFDSAGFVSPGLQRLISHHSTIEQILLNVHLVDVDYDMNGSIIKDPGYYCLPLDPTQENMSVALSDVDSDDYDLPERLPRLGAQVLIDLKGKHKLHPNDETTYSSFPINNPNAIECLNKSDKSHLFVLPQNMNSMTNYGEFVDFGKLSGWL